MKKMIIGVLIAVCIAFPLFQTPLHASSPPEFDAELCETLLSGIRGRASSIDVSSFKLKVSDVRRLIEHVKYDNPELFYFSECSYSYAGSYVRTLSPVYSRTGEELNDALADFEALLEDLYALCDSRFTPLEIALFYHDHFASHYEYDLSGGVCDAYGFLSEGKGVCQAYALTYMLVLRHFGIPCTYVTSDAMQHMWNAVYIDGAWYHVDVTHDDPTPDRVGRVCHDCFLTGSATTASLKSEAVDMVFGQTLEVSAQDHPVCALFAGGESPAVEAGEAWYSVLRTGEKRTALCRFDPATGQREELVTFAFDLSDDSFAEWSVADHAGYYLSNFSGLVTDGRCLYYNDARRVFLYDPSTGKAPRAICSYDGPESIYGLSLSQGVLCIYTGASPADENYTPVIVAASMPVYYTVKWVIGDRSLLTYAERGSDPLESFTGSTYKEEERGVRYTFAGWSPAPETVENDAVYTAMYYAEKLYTEGDVNGDGTADISDVSALLDCLASGLGPASFYAADMDENDVLNVQDVTLLLDLLSGAMQ